MTEKRRKQISLDKETWIIITIVACGVIATLSGMVFDPTFSGGPGDSSPDAVALNRSRAASSQVPLKTNPESIDQLFAQSRCLVCHTIPGIQSAQGRQGPKLVLGTTGPQRLADPHYAGQATTVREYIIESILSPGTYIVPGYPDRVMPRWYGQKLNAATLDKIATYLVDITDNT